MLKAKWKEYALGMCLADWLDGQEEQLFDALEEAPHRCEDGVFEGFRSCPRYEFKYLSKHALAALIIRMAYTAQCCERTSQTNCGSDTDSNRVSARTTC